MKTPPHVRLGLTAAETAAYLISRESANLALEAKWMVESAQVVADRMARDGTCGLSLVRDVITHAESLTARLTRIETLRDVLPKS